MNCLECEAALGMEESSVGVEEHLAGCAECRGLAAEIRSNSAAFEAMGNEELPGVRGRVMARIQMRAGLRWGWALAAAAAVVVMIGMSRGWREERMAIPPVKVASAPSESKVVRPDEKVVVLPAVAHKKKVVRGRPLMVKMLTDDPDVVIYWEIGTKEGSE